jgi:hypothetical protein
MASPELSHAIPALKAVSPAGEIVTGSQGQSRVLSETSGFG